MGNVLVAVDAVYPSFIAVSCTGPDHAFCSQRDYVRHNANGIRYYSGNRLCASGWETTSRIRNSSLRPPGTCHEID